MCGIAGWVDERPILPSLLDRMTGRLDHRGPDGGGIAIFDGERAGFGHRRLAILDPGETGAQPVERDGHFLVHNGEIYNFRDLRKADPDPSGYRSDGDAEVLLRQLMRKGPAALAELDGMFAFAYFDPRDRSLLLARDRLGIKPLYYFEKGATFLFASEPKALLEHFEATAEPDPEAMGDFLSYGYVPEDRCIFRGMRKLPPGCALLRRAGVSRITRYWEPARAAVSREPAEQLRELLDRAVQSHTVSDVPVGAFLSGGLDSSAVTSVLQRDAGSPVPTFTVAYGDGGLEDLTYARIAASSFGTRHSEEELVLGELDDELGEMADTFDEPVADSTSLAVFRLSRLARSQVKVVLSGDGGDEAFGGYGWHESFLAYEAWRRRVSPLLPLFSWVDRAVLPLARNRSWGARSSGLKKIVSPDPVERYFSLRAFFTGDERRSMFGRGLGSDDAAWLFRRFTRADLSPAARLCYLDLKTYLPDNNLALVDRASMAHGLEVRVPLLDRSVVEFALSLPDDLLVRPGSTKILFRKAIAPWIPRPILERPKYGFSPPFKLWVRAQRGEKALRRLRKGFLAREGIVDIAAVERGIAAGMPRRWNKLWLLLVLESWYRRWVVGREDPRYQPSRATARPTAAITPPAAASA